MPIDHDDHDNVDDNEDHLQVLTDPHSPGQFRVNGPFKNLREFSQVRCHGDDIWKSFKKKEHLWELGKLTILIKLFIGKVWSRTSLQRYSCQKPFLAMWPTDKMINIR